MSIDSIVVSLPTLRFEDPAPLTWEKFLATCCGEAGWVVDRLGAGEWADLETQLRNAMAEARGGDARFIRPASGCSLLLCRTLPGAWSRICMRRWSSI